MTEDLFCVRDSSGECTKSAVCAYKLSDINQVFSGRFLTERENGIWDRPTEEEPFPHPGSVSYQTRNMVLEL